MKLLLNVNLYLKVFPFHHVVYLGKTSNSRYKNSAFFLGPKILLYTQNFQWVQNSIFPIGKHFSQFIAKFV